MKYWSRCNIFNSFGIALLFRYIYKGRLVKISENIAFLFYKEIYMKYLILYYKTNYWRIKHDDYDQTYVLNEENIMLGVYLYHKLNIKEVLFVNFLMFVAKWAIWKFRNDIKYNNKKINTLKIKQMLKIELKSNTALITKSLLLNENIGKLL